MEMAPPDTRGLGEKKKKKPKNKARKVDDRVGETDISDLKTEEDEELLRNVEDEDGECDMDFDDDDGQEIDNSEISGFIKELGLNKYLPTFISSNEDGPKKQKKHTDPSDDLEIKEDKLEKKSKKKKNKFKNDDVEIKPDLEQLSENVKKKKKKEKNNGKKSEVEIKKEDDAGEKTSFCGKKGKAEETSLDKKEKAQMKAALTYLKTKKSRSYLLLKPGELWREEQVQPASKIGPEDNLVKEAESLAQRLFDNDTSVYAKQKENAQGSEARWVKTVLVSGTLSDKVAALTLMIRESPVYNVASLDTLLSMASKKGRREAMLALDTLTDLFMTGLLPDRILHQFHQFPISSLPEMTSGNLDQRDKLLVCWYFEDILKKKYSQLLKILGEMLFDSLQATKEKAIRTVFQLLTGKPEQENVLLSLLVNKLGDKSLHNKSANLIGKLMEKHPSKNGAIIREVCQLMYRPNVSHRAQYNSICLLTQIRLGPDDSHIAADLIKTYMSFFQIYLKKREIDSKTMSALLTGVNRAYPFAQKSTVELGVELNEVYKIIPSVNFQTGVQALMLLFYVTNADPATESRFYCALYRKLNDPTLANTGKQTLFLTLLFKSLKADHADNRVLAFIKRILQVYAHHPSQILCGVLIILSQILTEKPNLLSSVIKSRVVSTESSNSKKTPNTAVDEDEEERFVDLPVPEEFRNTDMYLEDAKKDEVNGLDTNNSKSSAKTTWLHRSHKKEELTSYDPRHRNPLYCRAELECIWELEELMNHFHPTVALYARTLLKGEAIHYPGDPIEDFTVIRFLDRFVYKNPKQPTILTNVGAKEKKQVHGIRLIPVTSEQYLKQRFIPEDEQYLFKYFSEKVSKKKEKVDDKEIDDDEFDDYLDKFMGGKKEDFGDMDLDFASDTAKSKKDKKGKADDSDSDDDDDYDDDDEDMDFGDDELTNEFEQELQSMENDGDGFNEEDVEFSPDEDDPVASMMVKPKGKKRGKEESQFEQSKKKMKKNKGMDLFTSAEEFSTMLEDGVESGSVSLGGSNDLINRDNAAKKQIAWEEKRDSWIHSKDRRSFKGKAKGKGKQFKQWAGGNKGKQKPGGKRGRK